MADQITIQVDRGHVWLLKVIGGVILLVAGFMQGLDICSGAVLLESEFRG